MLPTPLKKHDMIITSKIAHIESPITVALFVLRKESQMNYVEPIRSLDDIELMSSYLKDWNKRNYILFIVGINTGLRISDIVELRVHDIRGWYIVKRERKTKKVQKIRMNVKFKKELMDYVKDMKPNDYLFKSRNGKNKHITTQMGYLIVKTAAEDCGIENVGSHSMRKTFGYHHYRKHKDLALLMDQFNHASVAITKRYIGLNQDRKDQTLANFSLGIL